ncbi:MAG: hypothetical protein WA628_19450 [Terriglobales bacterium]
MTRAKLAGEIAKLLSGSGALLVGLSWLATMPLRAVLVILGAMGLTLTSAARLGGAEIHRSHTGLS